MGGKEIPPYASLMGLFCQLISSRDRGDKAAATADGTVSFYPKFDRETLVTVPLKRAIIQHVNPVIETVEFLGAIDDPAQQA